MSDGFNIEVEVRFIERESDPEKHRYVFAYTISISNGSELAAQLMSRYWRITDAEGRVEEVAGPGVVGKQPIIEPEQTFRYTSAAILETPVGSMEGHYEFQRGDEAKGTDTAFLVPIPAFSLSQPKLVH